MAAGNPNLTVQVFTTGANGLTGSPNPPREAKASSPGNPTSCLRIFTWDAHEKSGASEAPET
jgi:hypothetical protein